MAVSAWRLLERGDSVRFRHGTFDARLNTRTGRLTAGEAPKEWQDDETKEHGPETHGSALPFTTATLAGSVSLTICGSLDAAVHRRDELPDPAAAAVKRSRRLDGRVRQEAVLPETLGELLDPANPERRDAFGSSPGNVRLRIIEEDHPFRRHA